MINRRQIRIERIRLERSAGNQRVAADINGETLYFESPKADLRPAPEAFISALLLPALTRRADLVLDDPLDPIFLSGISQLIQTFGDWWGYQKIVIRSTASSPSPVHATPENRADPPGTVLCFSGGADSFFSLLCNDERIDALAFVHGFDIDLNDTERAHSFALSLEQVADGVSARPLLLKTNLREHAVYQGVNWDHAHGGALAAVGHVLAKSNRLIVAASYPAVFPNPSGSRWDIDPCWSSASLQVVHHGEKFWRAEKLRALSESPIVRSHLRVCWEYLGSGMNCSHCEKCVRTMLTLAQHGMLDAFPVFDVTGSLAERVAELDHIAPVLQPVYRAFLEPEIDPETSRSLHVLLNAKVPPPRPRTRRKRIWKRFKHALAR